MIPAASLAQEKPKSVTSMVGSFWVSTETSPAEQNDVVTQTHWDQGLTLWRSGRNSITPFVSTDFVVDTKGKDWNNKDKQVEVFSTMITLYLPLLKFLSYIIAVLIATKQ